MLFLVSRDCPSTSRNIYITEENLRLGQILHGHRHQHNLDSAGEPSAAARPHRNPISAGTCGSTSSAQNPVRRPKTSGPGPTESYLTFICGQLRQGPMHRHPHQCLKLTRVPLETVYFDDDSPGSLARGDMKYYGRPGGGTAAPCLSSQVPYQRQPYKSWRRKVHAGWFMLEMITTGPNT